MYRVVLLPPSPLATRVDEVRRRLDPAFHRVPAHVPLIAPFDEESPRVFEQFDRASRRTAFELSLGAAARIDDRLVLPLETGADEVVELQQALAEALGAAASERAPELLLGRSENAAELELAARSLAVDSDALSGFQVRDVTLLTEDARGLWVVARTRPLR